MYVSLHTHTEFSRLDGLSNISGLAQRAAELKMPALAITDHGNMFGAFKHYDACNQAGIKPIIGAEFYVSPSDRSDRVRGSWGQIEEGGRIRTVPGYYTHLTVLATGSIGLRNLYRLQALSYLEGFYQSPRIDRASLEEHAEGLIILSGCMGSEISTRLRLGQIHEAEETAAFFADVFPGRFFIEIMDHGIEIEKELNPRLLSLAHRMSLPLVATNDTHYTLESDSDVHDALLCIQTGSQLKDEKRFRFSGSGFYLKEPMEMLELFAETPEALSNTLLIAEMVDDYADAFRSADYMPVPILRDSGTGQHTVRQESQVRTDRRDYEWRTIRELGFEGYIRTIADIVGYAKSKGILVGPGRGSAGGSLVCYELGITDVDPIEHGLLFERFLNPARVSMPDIDIDFQDDRRKEVIQYAVSRYGRDRVAQIITLGREKSRSSLKDAARVLGHTAAYGQKLANQVPELIRGRQEPLSKVPSIGKSDPESYRLALGLEGTLRNYGLHAAGIIISPVPLADIIPVKLDDPKKSEILTAGFEESELTRLGLVKIDILGLANLTTIAKTLEFINS